MISKTMIVWIKTWTSKYRSVLILFTKIVINDNFAYDDNLSSDLKMQLKRINVNIIYQRFVLDFLYIESYGICRSILFFAPIVYSNDL